MEYYAIRDIKVGRYGTPFLQHNRGEAQRTFEGLIRDKNTSVGQWPEDHELWYLGEYDDVVGLITGKQPEFIGNGVKQ